VLNILETVLAMMMDAECRSARTTERSDTLIDLKYEINCCCSRCKASPVAKSALDVCASPASEPKDYNSLKVIEECLRCPNAELHH
jgi:hypothetical protein